MTCLLVCICVAFGMILQRTCSFAAAKYEVVETRLGPMHSAAEWETVSADGCHLAYIVADGQKQRVVVDGRPGPQYDLIWSCPFLSPDGNRVAYMAGDGGKQLVVVDGQSGPKHEGVPAGPIFSPDGTRVVYEAAKGAKRFVVVDGQPGPQYDVVIGSHPSFGAGGNVEYLAVKGGYLLRVKHVMAATGD